MRTPNCCCHIIKQDNRQVQINEAVGYLFFAIAIKDNLCYNVIWRIFKEVTTMEKIYNIAGYCRISVEEELDRDNTSIENQKMIIKDFSRFSRRNSKGLVEL